MTTSEPTQPSGTPADPAQQPQAGTPNTTNTPATPADAAQHNTNTSTTSQQPQAGTPDEPMSLEEAKKLRAESASLRKRIKEIDDAKAAADLAQLSELERAKKQLETATAQASTYRQAIAAMAVQLEATKLGFIDPADAATFLAGKLELDESGKPTNAEKLLKDLLAAKPYLVQSAQSSQQPSAPQLGATNPGRTGATQPAQQPKHPSQLAKFGSGTIFGPPKLPGQ